MVALTQIRALCLVFSWRVTITLQVRAHLQVDKYRVGLIYMYQPPFEQSDWSECYNHDRIIIII
jgi:hypothetical protein